MCCFGTYSLRARYDKWFLGGVARDPCELVHQAERPQVFATIAAFDSYSSITYLVSC